MVFRSANLKTISSLALPFVLLTGLVLLLCFPVPLAERQSTGDLLAGMAIGTAALLGLRFNRSRVVLGAALLLLARAVLPRLTEAGGAPGVPGHASMAPVLAVACTLLPLYLALFSLLTERGLLSSRALLRLLLLLAPAAVLLLLARAHHPVLLAALQAAFLPAVWASRTALPQLAQAAFLLAALLLGARLLLRRSPLDSGFAAALLALGLALAAGQLGPGSLLLAGAGLILAISVVQESYGMAYLDELTRLPGRRALEEELLKLGRRYALAMLDVDHFKKFNDRHGHEVGDQVLRLVARKMAEVGGGGRAFRYGGEEFTIIFPRSTARQALAHLEAVRLAIAGARLTLRGKDRPRRRPKKLPSTGAPRQQVSVTISIGLADSQRQRSRQGKDPASVLAAADRALYKAKRRGRNQVCQ